MTPSEAVKGPRKPAQPKLELTWLRADSLTPYSRNSRTHSKKQLNQIAASIREHGFVNPIIVNQDGVILAGHGRVAAAKLLGMETVPTIRIDHLSEAQIRAYVIADNRLAELAGWDREILKLELQGLELSEPDFDLEITGFDTAELDLLLDRQVPAKDDPADLVPPLEERAVTRPGDLWLLGDHRLFCGDACTPASYRALLNGDAARMAFTDPPFNVPIGGHVSGLGKKQHREFLMGSGEMSQCQFTDFLTAALTQMAASIVNGGISFVCMDWRHQEEILAAGKVAFSELKNLVVWSKTNAGMGTFYRSQHELIYVFKVGSASHTNTFGLGETGRYRTNVWTYPGVNTFRKGRQEDLESHPTAKPVSLISDAIKDVSRRREIVLDPFGGSGSTLIAAEKTKRFARVMELDPLYCDVICKTI